MPKKYTECCICRRPAASRSRYCNAHKSRLSRWGHAEGKPLDHTTFLDPQLAVARRYIETHKNTKGARAAFALVGELHSYRAETGITADRRLEQAWTYQRDNGADPAEVVARTVAFLLFVDMRPRFFRNQRSEDVALGRLALHVVPMKGHRWGATVYAPAGQQVRELLGVFAATLIRKVSKDAERVDRLRRESAEL